MSAKMKIIIDTDPGIDDILALLLVLSGKAEEIEVLLISLTFGNVEVRRSQRASFFLIRIYGSILTMSSLVAFAMSSLCSTS